METRRSFGLSGNQLKLIAMLTMTLDHIGLYLLPQVQWLRILGRLSLPIYAYMIAEGCRYTHSRKGYFARIAFLAAICQGVYFLAMGSLYQCILVTFCLSIGMIFCLDAMRRSNTWISRGLFVLAVWGAGFVCEILPALLPGTDFAVDYGFFGALLPVLAYWGKDRNQKVLLMGVGLVLLALDLGGIQWYALGALPLLLCYTGKKGRHSLGMVFYLYYPVHLVVIYLLGWIIL